MNNQINWSFQVFQDMVVQVCNKLLWIQLRLWHCSVTPLTDFLYIELHWCFSLLQVCFLFLYTRQYVDLKVMSKEQSWTKISNRKIQIKRTIDFQLPNITKLYRIEYQSNSINYQSKTQLKVHHKSNSFKINSIFCCSIYKCSVVIEYQSFDYLRLVRQSTVCPKKV